MKLSKRSWLILAIGICIIAFASIGAARAQRIEEQNQLREELSVAKLRLSKLSLKELSSQQEKLKEELSQTIPQYEAAKAKFSQLTDSIGASDTLFAIAETSDVEITEISSSGLTTEHLDGIPGTALQLTLKVKGKILNLISFIAELNKSLTTGIINSVEISIPYTDTTEEEGEQQSEEPSANIQLVIYTYQGD